MRFYQRGNTAVVPLKNGMTIHDIEVISKAEKKKRQDFFEMRANQFMVEDGGFVFINTAKFLKRLKKSELTLQQWGYFLLLLSKVKYKDKDLDNRMYIGQGRCFYKVTNIAKLWNVKVDTAERLLKEMVENQLIRKDSKNKTFYVVANFVHKGKVKVRKNIRDSVKVHAKPLLQLNEALYANYPNERMGMLGLVMLLLPSVDRDTQLLLRETSEDFRAAYETMDTVFQVLPRIKLSNIQVKDIQQLNVVKDAKTIKKYLKLLLECAVIEETGFNKGFVFNPLLANRQHTGDFEGITFLLRQYPTFNWLQGKPSAKIEEIRENHPKLKRILL